MKGSNGKACPDRVHARFAHFKKKHTFTSFQEAEGAMVRFLAALSADARFIGSQFLEIMEAQCREALTEARERGGFPTELGGLETCEWHIEPVGVALEHRRYDLTGTDEQSVLDAPEHRFPADYMARSIGESRDRDTISVAQLRLMLGITAEMAYVLLSGWPRYTYTGSLRALSRIRVSEGAVLCYMMRREWPLHAISRWPKMFASKAAIGLW